MRRNTLIAEFFTRPIAYHPIVAKAFGSVNLGILWSQLFYWSDKTRDADGWIYKTQKDLYDETALSRREQDTARKIGKELGVLEEKLAGNPATLHFRVNLDMAIETVEKFLEKSDEPPKKERKQKATGSMEWLNQIPDAEIEEISAKYGVDKPFILARADDVLTYCGAKGKTYKDYKLALFNFIKSHKGRQFGQAFQRRPLENALPAKEGKYSQYDG